MINKQIIASGGDAVSDSPLHYYLLAQSQKEKPKVIFLPTASGDNQGVIESFFSMFSKHHCDPDYLPLFHNKEKNIREFILEADIVLVGGGHSFSMMSVWRAWGLDKYLLEAYEKGIILAGGSAGSVCWFDEALSDSAPNSSGNLAPLKCLGFLPFSNCPHYRSRERRTAYKQAILNREISPGYAISDGASIHYINNKFHRAVSANDPGATCFYVDVDSSGKEEKIKSERLPITNLMDKKVQDELIWSSPAFNHLDSELSEDGAEDQAS